MADKGPLFDFFNRQRAKAPPGEHRAALEITMLLEYFGLPWERGSLEIALWLALLNGMVKFPGVKGRRLNSVVSNSREAIKKRRQRSRPKTLKELLLQNPPQSNAADEGKAGRVDRMFKIVAELSARAAKRDKI
jgi:hypothetical protein